LVGGNRCNVARMIVPRVRLRSRCRKQHNRAAKGERG